MPYVDVYLDDDVLEGFGESALREELARRSGRRGAGNNETSAISRADAKITLDEAAHRLRKLERFDLAFKLDEIKHDYF